MEPHMRDGDVLIVDRSTKPKFGKVVIAAINGEMTVKRLWVVDSQMTLTSENPKHPDVKIGDFNESMIWGVVTNFIHQLWKRLEVHEKTDTNCNCSKSPKPTRYVNKLASVRHLGKQFGVIQMSRKRLID